MLQTTEPYFDVSGLFVTEVAILILDPVAAIREGLCEPHVIEIHLVISERGITSLK